MSHSPRATGAPSIASWERCLDELDQSVDPRAQALAARMRDVSGELAMRFPSQLKAPGVLVEGSPLSASYTWDSPRYMVELYIWADGRLEWFFSDRQTNVSDGTGGVPVRELPPRFLERLGQLLLSE